MSSPDASGRPADSQAARPPSSTAAGTEIARSVHHSRAAQIPPRRAAPVVVARAAGSRAAVAGPSDRAPPRTPRSPSPAESAALPELLPLVHAEFALSELGYFHGVTRSAENTRLAYEYCVGHAEWFATDDGGRLLDVVAHAAGVKRGASTAGAPRQGWVCRRRRGDEAGRAEAITYGRSAGTPVGQLTRPVWPLRRHSSARSA
ncbi:hypothetical protein ACIRPU_19110 [Streptomyces sp. NPDC102259]|uniref:hypothetical protein n=1 Tax=Streptomyces sp. NPDC102259 TaxID=3366148 RepID=UPI0037F9B756